MRVPDFVLKCVGFLGDVVKGCETNDLNPQATAFFVSVRSSVQNAGSYYYVVTAKHASNNLKGPLWLSANTPSGRVLLEPDFRERHWYHHPTDPTADVAVTPFGVTPDIDLVTVPCGAMPTPPKIRDYEIGIGDEVFFSRLFYDIPGSTQNTPILRHGNLADGAYLAAAAVAFRTRRALCHVRQLCSVSSGGQEARRARVPILVSARPQRIPARIQEIHSAL
jgi:hypothetical protein